MGFSLVYLVFGLPLLGVPVLLHLLKRPKAVSLPFPALRFLRGRHPVRKRQRQVRHWLLLALRVLVLAALCWALIPPLRFEPGAAGPAADQPVDAVFVFDTSASMAYQSGEHTRLAIALDHARTLLDALPPGSRVARLDSGDPTSARDEADLFKPPSLARSELEAMEIRPANAPLNGAVQRAWRMLQQVADGQRGRALYVFSDRTRACWDSTHPLPAPPVDVRTVFVDVGENELVDLAIDALEMPPAAAPGDKVELRVRLRATGSDQECGLVWYFEDTPDRLSPVRSVRLGGGEEITEVFSIPVPALPPQAPSSTPCQVTARLVNKDPLTYGPFVDRLNSDNVRHATFLIRQPQRVLALGEPPALGQSSSAQLLQAALHAVKKDNPLEAFQCDIRSPTDPGLKGDDLARDYAVVCLCEVTNPSDELWKQLKIYVGKGGGLLLIPAGDEGVPQLTQMNQGAEFNLLPGRLTDLVTSDKSLGWSPFTGSNALFAPFQAWTARSDVDFAKEGRRPAVWLSWKVSPLEGAVVDATYQDGRPAVLEREFGAGKVVMLTAPLKPQGSQPDHPRNNYWSQSSFGLVLVDQVCRHLARATPGASVGVLNWPCEAGKVVTSEAAPGAVLPCSLVCRGTKKTPRPVAPDQGGRFTLTQADTPGNYVLEDASGRMVAGFSLNVPAAEYRLERVPIEELETALGKDTVVPVGAELQRPRMGGWGFDLLPWLLLALLFAVAGEAFLANSWAPPPATPAAPRALPSWVVRACAGGLVGLLLGALVGGAVGAGWAVVARSGTPFDQATRFALVAGLLGVVSGAVAALQMRRGEGTLPQRQAAGALVGAEAPR